ncbi:MAG: hypothetical protein ACOYIS_07980 [Candidatus Cloacimonadaceae bacterium]|jgi:hypothetical protein
MKTKVYEDLPHVLKDVQDQLLQLAVHTAYSKDVRAVLIFEDDPPNIFETLQPLVQFVRKKRLIPPWIFTRKFVEESLDAYPLEFLDICTAYSNLICNSDILKGLKFDKTDLRLQMERELRGKWLLTRQALLDNPYKPASVRNTIVISRAAVYPVLKGLLHVHDQAVPNTLEEAIQQAGEICKIDLSPLSELIAGMPQATRYLDTLKKLIHFVQRLTL